MFRAVARGADFLFLWILETAPSGELGICADGRDFMERNQESSDGRPPFRLSVCTISKEGKEASLRHVNIPT